MIRKQRNKLNSSQRHKRTKIEIKWCENKNVPICDVDANRVFSMFFFLSLFFSLSIFTTTSTQRSHLNTQRERETNALWPRICCRATVAVVVVAVAAIAVVRSAHVKAKRYLFVGCWLHVKFTNTQINPNSLPDLPSIPTKWKCRWD